MPVPTLTTAQVSQVRQRPHRTRVWLSVFQPGTVLSARINHAGITKGERVINYTLVAGDFNSVNRGMTCYLGTTLGGRELGRIRAISATAGTITVAENAVAWVTGWYLTVVAYYEPWAVFPRILLVSNVPVFYKDYDIAYTNQNQFMCPVVCMGPNHAGFLVTGGYGVYYTSTGSFDPTDGSPPTGFLWNFEGGNPSGSALPDPGWIQYSGAGHFLTSLLATTDSGKTLTGHRHVSIYSRPDEGPAFPILKWGMRSFEGSRDQGGYAIRFFLREQADFSKIAEGALVVLFTDDWQGGVAGKAASGAEHRETILFNGYIEDDSVTVNPETNVLEFNAASITQVMQRLSTYSWALDDVETPANWTQMNDMTVDKAVIHFLCTQSTVMEIADYSWTGDAKKMQYADFGRGDLYQCANGLYASALFASLVADRQGKMWAEMDANLVTTGSSRLTALGAGFTITRQDWRGTLNWTRQQDETLAYLEYGGIYYSGPSATGSSLPLLAVAPGDVAGYFGGVERTQGLVILDQNAVNVLVGLGYAKANADFPELSMPIAGEYRFFDIAPQSRLLVSLTAAENWRGLVWNAKPFIPQAISYEVQAESQMMTMDVRAREETHGPPGTTLVIPVEPPYDDPGLPYWDIPFPPIMPWPPIWPPIIPEPGTKVVFVMQDGGIFRCANITLTPPVWVRVTIPGGSYVGSMVHAWLNIYNPLDQAFIWTQFDTGSTDTDGPYGYLVSGLSTTTSAWVNIWGNAENVRVYTPGLQRRMNFMGQSASLGYFLGMPHGTDIGLPGNVMAYGSIGSWSILTLVHPPAGGFGANDGGNIGHLGGSTLIGAGGGDIGRSDTLGNSWTLKTGPGGAKVSHSMTSDGLHVIWGHANSSAGTNHVFAHAAGLSPIANAWTDAIDITPTIGAIHCPPPQRNGSWHIWRTIANAGPSVYMLSLTSNNDWRWLKKFSWLPTSADWVDLYTFAAGTQLVGIDVSLANPLHVIAHAYTGAVTGKLYYTEDGGATWQDKTGNLVAAGWVAATASRCQFAIASASADYP